MLQVDKTNICISVQQLQWVEIIVGHDEDTDH